MRKIETLTVPSRDGNSRIELLVGDLSAIPEKDAVDALVVSAFEGDYMPTSTSLIGALDRKGLSVRELARKPEVDLRDTSSCWLSRPIERPDLHFRQLVCFETKNAQRTAPSAVGDVFRSLIPYVNGEPWIKRVAMPLLAAGNQEADPIEMVKAILEAAIHWLSNGLPLEVMKIVVYEGASDRLIAQVTDVFRSYRAKVGNIAVESEGPSEFRYDLFVSYSHADKAAVDRLVTEIKALDPQFRIFVDRTELDVGTSWQRRIFEDIDSSRRILCLYSPEYLVSDVCIEEYNIAYLRNREQRGVLVPAYLRTATRLPSFMRLVQYVDLRESDADRLKQLARTLVGQAPDDDAHAPDTLSRSNPPATSNESQPITISISADASAEMNRIVDILVSGGKELRFDVRMRGVAPKD
jgi:hypothetical protein